MAMVHYVALLRGINVGGKNLIKMEALRACFEELGFSGVATYIQSGNVIFKSDEKNGAKLALKIEKALASKFRYDASIVLRSKNAMQQAVEGAPAGFGKSPAKYRYDVLFLKEPLSSAEVMKVLPLKEGVDQAHAGKGLLYHSRLISKATQSRLSRLVSMPVYQRMTIRNWNTSSKLLQLMQDSD